MPGSIVEKKDNRSTYYHFRRSLLKFNKFNSRGSPGSCIRFSFLQNLQIDITGRFADKSRVIDS